MKSAKINVAMKSATSNHSLRGSGGFFGFGGGVGGAAFVLYGVSLTLGV
jgi:hypothetical protein